MLFLGGSSAYEMGAFVGICRNCRDSNGARAAVNVSMPKWTQVEAHNITTLASLFVRVLVGAMWLVLKLELTMRATGSRSGKADVVTDPPTIQFRSSTTVHPSLSAIEHAYSTFSLSPSNPFRK